MTTQEQLKIYAAYLPHRLELQVYWDDPEHSRIVTMVAIDTDEIYTYSRGPESWYISGRDEKHNMRGNYGIRECKPILYDLSHLTKEIEHEGKKFQVIKEILNQASVYDLTDCIFEINEDDENVYIDAYKNGRLIDALHYDGNVFIMNRDDKYHPPQLELHDILLKYHFNVFGIPAGDFIDKSKINL